MGYHLIISYHLRLTYTVLYEPTSIDTVLRKPNFFASNLFVRCNPQGKMEVDKIRLGVGKTRSPVLSKGCRPVPRPLMLSHIIQRLLFLLDHAFFTQRIPFQ